MDQQNQQQQRQLPPNELWPFEHNSTRYDCKAQQGITPEDLLVPAFWAHSASRLRPWDEVRVRAEDGTWLANCLVLDSSRTWAKVRILSIWRLTTADVSLTKASEEEIEKTIAQYTVVWRGPLKWSVTRKADKAVMLEGKEQKDEAIAWLREYAKNQVGAPADAPKAEPVPA